MNTFAERLTYVMDKYNVTGKELSRRTGIHPGDISHYRKGDYYPKRDRIYLISQALNVSPGWLMGFDLPENQFLLDEEIVDMWHQLSVTQQEEIYHHIRTLLVNQTEES